MKVLHVIQSLSRGGVTNVVIESIKAFCRLNIENIVIAPQISNSLKPIIQENTSQVYLLGGNAKPFNSIEYILLTKKHINEIVKRENPDAVIVQPGWLSLYSYFLPRNLPILIVVHGTYLNEIKYMWYHPIRGVVRLRYINGILLSQAIELFQLRMSILNQNATIIAVSKNTKKELGKMGVPTSRIVSILNGVNKERFKPMNKDLAKTLVEELFGTKLKVRVLLHVNPGPRKGTHILIKAFAILKKIYGEDLMLLIVGRLGPKTYREYVEELIRSLDLEGDVVMLGYVENEKLPVLYNAADLTVVPSYSEGGPLITPESLACGTPVVATNVGGNPEYLKLVDLTHLLINIEKYDFACALANGILRALEHENFFRQSILLNYRRIPSWEDSTLNYVKLLEVSMTRFGYD